MSTGKKSSALITPPGIASYAYVWKPQEGLDGGEAKYSVTLIMSKKADLTKLKEAMKAAAVKKFGPNPNWKKLHSPFKDGDEERENDPMYAGKIFITARSSTQPRIVDKDLNPITDEFEFYSGAKCRLSVYAYGYDSKGNKGVTFGLNNIQKLADGERLSGRRAPEEEFADADDDDEDSDDNDFLE